MSARPRKRQSHTTHHLPAQRGGGCDARSGVWMLQGHCASAGGLGEAKIWQVAPGWTRRGPCQPPEREVKGASGRARLRARRFNPPLRSWFRFSSGCRPPSQSSTLKVRVSEVKSQGKGIQRRRCVPASGDRVHEPLPQLRRPRGQRLRRPIAHRQGGVNENSKGGVRHGCLVADIIHTHEKLSFAKIVALAHYFNVYSIG